MLSPSTLHHLGTYTCPACERTLGRFHCYPLLDPAQAISLTAETAPMHLECAKTAAEDHLGKKRDQRLLTPGPACVSAVAVVKSSPHSPSAKIARLDPEDKNSLVLVLFSLHRLFFEHVTFHDRARMSRPATEDEVFQWLQPAIIASSQTALPGTDERHELTRQLGYLQTFITPPQTPTD